MKELSSSEFRRTFARLTEPVTVTVLGRPIATYTPIGKLYVDGKEVGTVLPGEDGFVPSEPTVVKMTRHRAPDGTISATFRPVPKPTRKR